MPTDITDASIAIACVYCMLLARGGALDNVDGLSAAARAAALGSATVIFGAIACALTYALSLPLPALDAALQPFAAMALAVVTIAAAGAITHRAHKPLQVLLQQLRPWLLPATLLTCTATLLAAPAQNLLHTVLGATINGLLLSLLLSLCVVLSQVMANVGVIAAVPRHTPRFHALTLAVAAVLAFAGSAAARYW